jgi:hypothetical protein
MIEMTIVTAAAESAVAETNLKQKIPKGVVLSGFFYFH